MQVFAHLVLSRQVCLDGLSDPSSVVAQAAQAIIADFDSMVHASDDDVAT